MCRLVHALQQVTNAVKITVTAIEPILRLTAWTTFCQHTVQINHACSGRHTAIVVLQACHGKWVLSLDKMNAELACIKLLHCCMDMIAECIAAPCMVPTDQQCRPRALHTGMAR